MNKIGEGSLHPRPEGRGIRDPPHSLSNKTGKDQYGRWVAVVHLVNPDGSLNLTRNFNRMLVDSGHAVIEDFKNNEFDPKSWWSDNANTYATRR
jgi:endonuclease YncB( thermonuclease family)